MTLTDIPTHPTGLAFRKAVMVYDLDAEKVSYCVDDGTVYYNLPARLQPGDLMSMTRAVVPPEIGVALTNDFPTLRGLRDLAQMQQSGFVNTPEFRRLRWHVRALTALVIVKGIAIMVITAEPFG